MAAGEGRRRRALRGLGGHPQGGLPGSWRALVVEGARVPLWGGAGSIPDLTRRTVRMLLGVICTSASGCEFAGAEINKTFFWGAVYHTLCDTVQYNEVQLSYAIHRAWIRRGFLPFFAALLLAGILLLCAADLISFASSESDFGSKKN